MERGHELEQLHANKSGSSVSQHSTIQLKAVRWDVSFADRLLFPGTTIIFGICAMTLLLTKAFFALIGEIDATCWCPAPFTGNQVEYANRFCLHSTSLRGVETVNHFPDFNSNGTEDYQFDASQLFRIGGPEVFNRLQDLQLYYIPVFQLHSFLINLVLLTLVPTLAWRLLVSVDGVGLLTLPSRSKQPGGLARGGVFTTLWFIITQFMTAVVGLVLFIWLYTWGKHMTIHSYSSNSLIPQQSTALCDFSIQFVHFLWKYASSGSDKIRIALILGIGSVHQYTVQCLFVKTDARDVIEYGVYQLCLVWSVLMLTAAVLNAAIVLIFAILASCKSKIVSWYIGHEDRQFETRLSWSDIFVCLLAGRCGDGLMVGQILQTAYSEMKQD